MTKATHTPPASSSIPSFSPTPTVEVPFTPLLITFLMKKHGAEIQVRCRGCREIVPLRSPGPSRLKGVIELDGQFVGVLDANAWLGAQEIEMSPCSCIVVIEREWKSQRLRTGVIVGDIEEVMQFAAGAEATPMPTGISTNMDFVVELFNTATLGEQLAEACQEPG